MSKPARREFIPKIREMIAKSVPAPESTVNEIIDRWRDGYEPRFPLDHGVFAVCDQIATDLDSEAARIRNQEEET